MNIKIKNNFLIMFLFLCICFVSPLMAVDLQPGSDSDQQSTDPQLQKALGHLARAIAMKQSHDLDAAIGEYLKGVSVSPEITKYSDEGIVLEIIKKYEVLVNSNNSGNTNAMAVNKKIETLDQQIEDLNTENKDLKNQINSLQNENSGKDEEYEKEIAALKTKIEELDHMRAVYKGRWLREKD